MRRGEDARSTLRERQGRKLAALLGAIVPVNRFYAEKLAASDVVPADIRGLDDLERLPFTTKEELQRDQERFPPSGSNLSYPPERFTRLHQTSGTTGQPIRWLDSREDWAAILDCWQVIYDAAGVTPEDRFFFPFSFGPFIGFWAAFDGAVRRGNLSIPGGGLSSAARVRWIVEHGVTILCCTPTYALRLAEVAAEEGIDLASSRVRGLIVAGEPGGSIAAVRGQIETLWGARCFDHWGMTEVGPLGFEPLDRPGGVHLIESHCIAEIVDPATGRRLDGPGRGELVVTTLERRGCPVLRYRTGDIVEAAAEADPEAPFDPLTGEPYLRLEGGVLGRTDQMVLIRGNNVYPGAIDAVVRTFPEVVEYRAEVVQSASGNRLRVALELRADAAGIVGIQQRFARAFQDRFFFRPDVELAPAGTLPRFELKARRFVIRPEGAGPECEKSW